jgi:HK97 family phage portal protein
MNLFGLQITRAKSLPVLSGVAGWSQSLWGLVREPFAGAWQKNMELETRQNITAFSAVYACVALIANDIAKLRVKLMQQDVDGIWSEVRLSSGSPFLRVLQKPNAYQTRVQFWTYYFASKLIYGNVYVLKERELGGRGMVRALYCLDPRLVTPMVADDGSVWYQLAADKISALPVGLTLPASEIIHDRCVTLWHPLVGVSPIYAAGASATQGIRIQANSERFFANMSAPSGHLSAAGTIKDETAERLRRDFEAAKGGVNLGKLLVTGDGMKYEPFSMPAVDAQLIEQLKWTIEDVARCFSVPLHKIQAGQLPQVGNMAALDQAYYAQPLQPLLEAAEICLDEGLELDNVTGKTLGTEFDTDALLRMDPLTRADRLDKLIKAGTMKPNEARASENMTGVEGGDQCYLQQQNFSLAALAKRDALPNPFVIDRPAANPTPSPAGPAISADPTQEPKKGASVSSLLVHRFLKEERCVA